MHHPPQPPILGEATGLQERGHRELVGADGGGVALVCVVGQQHVHEGAEGVQGRAEAAVERDEGGVGGGVAARRFVEQVERVGVEAALEVGLQEGVGRDEGLGRVERAGLEEDGVERGGERRVAPPRGPTKEADGGGSGGGGIGRR